MLGHETQSNRAGGVGGFCRGGGEGGRGTGGGGGGGVGLEGGGPKQLDHGAREG